MLSAVYLSSGQVFAADSDIEFVKVEEQDEKGATVTTYFWRFKSGNEWIVLTSLEPVVARVFDEKPERV